MFVGDFSMRINFKPLVPIQAFEKYRPEAVLRRMKRELLKHLKSQILQQTFSDAAKKKLASSMKIVTGPSSITVIALDKAFNPLLGGQRAGQMRWLLKAKGPIPIVLDDGTVIFRSATARSMANGSWYHPGREATTVIEKARKASREIIKARLRKDMAGFMRRAMG